MGRPAGRALLWVPGRRGRSSEALHAEIAPGDRAGPRRWGRPVLPPASVPNANNRLPAHGAEERRAAHTMQRRGRGRGSPARPCPAITRLIRVRAALLSPARAPAADKIEVEMKLDAARQPRGGRVGAALRLGLALGTALGWPKGRPWTCGGPPVPVLVNSYPGMG